jgi:hypothetical protein
VLKGPARKAFLNGLPFHPSRFSKLVQIANDPRIPKILHRLPLSDDAIYHVTLLSDKQLRLGLRTGIINEKAKREDIESLRQSAPEPDATDAPQGRGPRFSGPVAPGAGEPRSKPQWTTTGSKQQPAVEEEDELSKFEKELAGEETGEEEDDFSKFEKQLAGDESTEQHLVTFEDLKDRWEKKGLLRWEDWDRAAKKDRERFKAEVLR